MKGLALRSTIAADGRLTLALEETETGEPGPDELIVRIEAAPINPSDLGVMVGPAEVASARSEGAALILDVPPERLAMVRARIGQALPLGNEGAGTVVAAGANVGEWLGRRVGMAGGGMYAHYRRLPARACMPIPDGASMADGAAMFVNPLTALGFVETMRAEGHKAIVHTAAASNLGLMVARICRADNIPLVAIVRSPAQAEAVRGEGVRHVLDSNAPDFAAALADAIAETGATIGFDAIGGGKMAGRILNAMEQAAARSMHAYSVYGSNEAKQVYIYGALDPGPTILDRRFGFAWSLGGWLLTPFLQKIGPEGVERLRRRVSAELTTVFASRYTATIGLRQAIEPETFAAYQRKATGEKYLIDPTR